MRRQASTLFASFALSALCLAPASAVAAPVVLGAGFLNSEIAFGGPNFQDRGYDASFLGLYGVDLSVDWDVWDTHYEASGGVLVQHTLNTDGGGAVVSSNYRYEGGLFVVNFHLSHQTNGESRIGTFSAPIEVLEFTAPEPGHGNAFSIWYGLGPGQFSAAFAAAFGIPTQTGSGYVDLPVMVLLNDEDHTSTERLADDGGGNLDVFAPEAVPEPSLGALATLGLAAALGLRRRRRSRA